ncbi:MAG: undecaprenyldiphospho-muramoylpentapeptide beta-N-acetylglucosaminyltransferase [Candidatus Nanopelagicales bacterium]|nr:undecaprenyldiphospho-muramoylpentapeptide beta-N-acetylglucosaminyltransferase [Candidatus Nanopelagicales bacterium]
MKVLLAAGGTAGHIEPALTLADTLVGIDPATEVVFVGRSVGLEARLVPERGRRLRTLPAVPMPRKPSKDLLLIAPRMAGSVRQMRRILAEEKPDVVVGFGGYVAVPAYLAARSARVPIVIHEANARAGMANKLGARFTPWVAEAVSGSIPGATYMGMPMRTSIVALDRAGQRAAARAHFGLDPDRVTLLVFGGSLGAKRLNEVVTGAAADLRAAGVQVLHAVGESAAGVVPVGDDGVAYVTLPYIHRMDLAYAAADLAITRAGAMTCAELAAVGLPAVYVPLPIGNGEQRLNAQPVVTAGGGLLIEDADFTAGALRAQVLPLIADPQRLAEMGRAASAHGVRDGAERLANMVRTAGGA